MNKKPINADYSALTEKIETNLKALKFNVNDRVKISKHKNIQEKRLYHVTGFDTSYLAAKKDFIALKTEVDKLDIKKLVSVPASLNKLKTKVDDLDVGKLKTVLIDLKKLSNVVDKEVIKNTKLNKLKTNVDNLEKKIQLLDSTTLIHITQCNTKSR